MQYFVRALVLTLLPVLLGGCFVESKVTTFHYLSEGQSLDGSAYVVPGEGASSGIEFDLYANRVLTNLQPHGITKASSRASADYIIRLGYSIDSGKSHTYSTPEYGLTGGGSTFHSGTIYGSGGTASYSGTSYTIPQYGVTGYSTQSHVKYGRKLTLDISDRRTGKRLWEGRNLSEGGSNELVEVIPTMIDAALQDFPGESGKTRRTTTPLD